MAHLSAVNASRPFFHGTGSAMVKMVKIPSSENVFVIIMGQHLYNKLSLMLHCTKKSC